VLNEDELPAAGRKLVEMEAFDLMVVFAFNNACPHLRFPLGDSGVTEEGVLICKWHQSWFDLFAGGRTRKNWSDKTTTASADWMVADAVPPNWSLRVGREPNRLD